MKTYAQYLVESEKTYKFRVKIADDVTDDHVDRIEKALMAHDVVSVSKPKRLPIQDNPHGFSGLGPVPVYIVDVELRYPTTEEHLRMLVIHATKFPATHVLAGTEGQDADVIKIEAGKDGEAILTKDYEKSDPKVKELYGDANIKMVLKDLDDKKRVQKFEKPNNEKAASTNDLEQGNKSPVGSNQNKIPDPMQRKAGK